MILLRNFYLKFHLFIFPLLVLIGFVFFYRSSVRDSANEIQKVSLQIQKKQKLINLYRQKIEVAGKLASLLERFPESVDLKWLMQNLNQIVMKKKLEIISIQPLAIEKGSFYKTLRVSLELQGSYNQIGEMMEEIDNSKNYLEVKEIKLSPLYQRSEAGEKTLKVKDKEGNTVLNSKITIGTIVPELR